MERVASLDLVRGLAAFSVAIPHYFSLSSTDWPTAEAVSVLAVEVFFVLSGFVLAPQILFCARDGRLASLRTFLVRRWMRTIPAYLVALLAISLLTDQLINGDFVRYALYVQNAFSQHNVQDYFPVAWSLSVEEWFYVTFPALVFVCAKAFRRADLTFAIVLAVGFIAVVTALRTLLGDMQSWDGLVRRVVVFRIDSIGYGFLLYVAMERLAGDWSRKPGPGTYAIAVAILAGCALLAFHVAGRALGAGQGVGRQLFPFAAAAFGMSVIAAFCIFSPLFAGKRISAFCIYLGRVSYSIYLFHIMLIALLRPALESFPVAVQIAGYVAACLAFSSLFYAWFEKPILAARPRFRPAADKAAQTEESAAGALSLRTPMQA